MSLLQKLMENSRIKESTVLSKSAIYKKQEEIVTSVPALNIALSGRIDGGLNAGITVFAGPSKHFKTSFCLLLAKAFIDKYKDSVILFYDSEFGANQQYFESAGINPSRVLHCPITDVEQLKFDIMNQLQSLGEDDKVMILIDSIGNLASKKEVDNATDAKSVADMTRAKELKSLFRIITPHIKMKNIPLIAVNHTYKEMSLFPRDIVSGGTGIVYSADNIYIIGRQQEKDGKELTGYNFIINVEKSRFVKEKSKIPISFDNQHGISQWSGLLDMALESGHVTNPTKGNYMKHGSQKKYKFDDTNTEEFWKDVLSNESFCDFIRNKYSLNTKLIDEEEPLEE